MFKGVQLIPSVNIDDRAAPNDRSLAYRRSYSVVIATYRRPGFLIDCIESLIHQVRPPEEIIVVDDDEGREGILDLVKMLFPSVVVIVQANSGRALARNRGAAAATSDWLCFIDDDDLWHKEKLSTVDGYLKDNPDCMALNHPVWFFRPNNQKIGSAYGFSIDFSADSLAECHAAVSGRDPSKNSWQYLNIKNRSFEMLLERNRGALSASVIRRDVFQTAGGFLVSLDGSDDWLLFLAVARITEWHTIPRRLGFCRQHASQGTTSIENTQAILAAISVAWFGGRPFPAVTDRETRSIRLDTYRYEYRSTVQHFIWAAVHARRWDLIPILRAMARPLLQRRCDRLFVLFPPRVASKLWPRAHGIDQKSFEGDDE